MQHAKFFAQSGIIRRVFDQEVRKRLCDERPERFPIDGLAPGHYSVSSATADR
jgi:hypothetical protein